jgi:hypothetical protein
MEPRLTSNSISKPRGVAGDAMTKVSVPVCALGRLDLLLRSMGAEWISVTTKVNYIKFRNNHPGRL